MRLQGQDIAEFWHHLASSELVDYLNTHQLHGLLGVLGAMLFFAATLDTTLTRVLWREFGSLVETAARVSSQLDRSACDEALLLPLSLWTQLRIPVRHRYISLPTMIIDCLD